jgi:hypothetical protein
VLKTLVPNALCPAAFWATSRRLTEPCWFRDVADDPETARANAAAAAAAVHDKAAAAANDGVGEGK